MAVFEQDRCVCVCVCVSVCVVSITSTSYQSQKALTFQMIKAFIQESHSIWAHYTTNNYMSDLT